jgi:hypothetical protein
MSAAFPREARPGAGHVRRALATLVAASIAIARCPLAAAEPTPPPSAAAQDPRPEDPSSAQARADYDAARLLLRDHHDAAALLRFRASYALRRDPKVLANIALCEKNMNHPARAATLFSQVLAGDTSSFPPAQREQLRSLLSESLAGAGRLRVSVAPWPAVVQIDDRAVTPSELATDVLVDSGVHRVRVWKDGYRAFERDVSVSGAGQAMVYVELQAEPRAEAPRSPPLVVGHRVPTWMWVAGGVVLGAAVFVAADSVFQ